MKTFCIVAQFLIAIALLGFTGCNSTSESNDVKQRDIVIEKESTNFWGHGTFTYISDNLPNGYKVSVFYKEKDNLCIWHFQRGDSIDRYIAGHALPWSLYSQNATLLYDKKSGTYYEPLDTTFILTIDIPIVKQLDDIDAASGGICFMDVNFDGQEEFIIAHLGYNRTYYACFDLVSGVSNSVCPGFLEPMNGEVYGNLVGGLCGKTEFDHKEKVIHITEQIGCCEKVESWAKPIQVDNSIEIRIFKKVDDEFWANGEEHIMTYQLVNDSLKEISHEIITK